MIDSRQILFRRATRDDLPAIIGLLAEDDLGRGRENPQMPPDARYVEAFAVLDGDPSQLLAVAERNGVVVGCFQASFIPGLSRLGMPRGQIESVRVAKSERGKGIGQAMMEWATEECRKRGCALVQLTTDKSRSDAHRFYQRLGFVASHEGMKRPL